MTCLESAGVGTLVVVAAGVEVLVSCGDGTSGVMV